MEFKHQPKSLSLLILLHTELKECGILTKDKVKWNTDYLVLMPVGKNLKDDDGKNDTDLFWIWYPSIRKILHEEQVFNDKTMQPEFLLINYLFLEGLVLLFIKKIMFMEIEPLKIIKIQARINSRIWKN